MPRQIVVLGMHRTGTSLVASILHALGINMGDEMLGPQLGNPHGHYECLEFLKLNEQILEAAGGSWGFLPPQQSILEVEPEFREQIRFLVKYYDERNEIWGWKDPRTCATIPLYHDHLTNPTYIICTRPKDDVVYSLYRRHNPQYEFQPAHWYLDRWAILHDDYLTRIGRFVNSNSLKKMYIDYDKLTDRTQAHIPVNKIVDEIGVAPEQVRHAFHQIRFRQ